MNEQSAFIINEESHEKIVKEIEEEKRKERKREKTNARQRAYYYRQKNLKKNGEIIKTVPKSNAERQRKFRQHKAEKSYMDASTEEFVEYCRKRHPSSTWNYFLKSSDQQSAKCKICSRVIKTTGSSTKAVMGYAYWERFVGIDL
ncbi:unnamed protein product [Colias eurytheme]|nr:unnamed protein product [Colias eurytheme]